MELFIISAISIAVGFVAGAIIFYFYGKSAQAKAMAELNKISSEVKKVL